LNEKKLDNYISVRKQIKTGDLVEFASASLVGRAIRWVTKRDVNHTALVISPRSFAGLRNRRILLEAMADGIVPNLLSDRILKTNGSIFWVPLAPEFDNRRDMIGEWAALEFLQFHPKYDFGSLFKNAIGRVSIDARKYFCSEFAHSSWIKAGILPSGMSAARPGEFGRFGVTLPRVRLL